MKHPAGDAAPGTRPAGISEADIPQHVQAMFDRIAPTYDRANHLLSLSIDRWWRRCAVVALRQRLEVPGPLLDLCCGTGDLAQTLGRTLRGRAVVGADFSPAMLRLARRKTPAVIYLRADALQLPLADGTLGAITIGFGFRNLRDYRAGLGELLRVLRPGGWLVILEAGEPTALGWAQFYRFYFHRLMPWLGGWISGDRAAYRYLPASVERFPAPGELAEWMRAAGFTAVGYRRFLGGTATLHLAQRAQ